MPEAWAALGDGEKKVERNEAPRAVVSMPADASVWMLQIYKKSPREASVFSCFCAAVEDIFRFVYKLG